MADELAVEDFAGDIQQLKNHGVAYGVIDRCAFFAAIDEIAGAQAGELLRNGGLVGIEKSLEFIHALFAGAQVFQDRQSRGVCQSFEKLGLEDVNRLVHRLALVQYKFISIHNIQILSYLSIRMQLYTDSKLPILNISDISLTHNLCLHYSDSYEGQPQEES